ncbi:hypothetical protein Fmac_025092 [Flemingia macrophylla]|uniref:H15 domain-containing protein n=1 Tax=Flemingia macrophylla TaxID=520843 RepID=A0ABD1LR79_9FABA
MTKEDRKRKLVMAKLKKTVSFRLKALNPSASINAVHAFCIEDHLQHLFKFVHTPTHPHYAQMIKRAIKSMNEESGSTEEAISEFIRREYEDLPVAHLTVLNVHLRKLCTDGVLVCRESERYVLLVDRDNVKDTPNRRAISTLFFKVLNFKVDNRLLSFITVLL